MVPKVSFSQSLHPCPQQPLSQHVPDMAVRDRERCVLALAPLIREWAWSIDAQQLPALKQCTHFSF